MKTHEQFVKALKLSRESVWTVGEWLTQMGYNARILPSTISPNHEERHDHVDMGDIEITQRIEVKHSTLEFNSLKSFPYDRVIIDETYKIQKYKLTTLYGYVLLNKDKSGALLISANTKEHWFTKAMFDKLENEDRRFTCCPTKHVKYIEFNDD